MSNSKRLLGIDLCCVIAAYAVIQVHSGDETSGLPLSHSAISFRLLFYFAVPFFLAVSFLFSVRKSSNSDSWIFWSSKVNRILIPYISWSLLYLVIRATFFSAKGDFFSVKSLLGDPLSLIFFGGTSYQLYFLPLLLTETLLIPLIYRLEKSGISNRWLY